MGRDGTPEVTADSQLAVEMPEPIQLLSCRLTTRLCVDGRLDSSNKQLPPEEQVSQHNQYCRFLACVDITGFHMKMRFEMTVANSCSGWYGAEQHKGPQRHARTINQAYATQLLQVFEVEDNMHRTQEHCSQLP